jgi:hypothetical protein
MIQRRKANISFTLRLSLSEGDGLSVVAAVAGNQFSYFRPPPDAAYSRDGLAFRVRNVLRGRREAVSGAPSGNRAPNHTVSAVYAGEHTLELCMVLFAEVKHLLCFNQLLVTRSAASFSVS